MKKNKLDVKAIKKLRDETGARMIDCKKALEEAEGDFDEAIEIVEKAGLARAEEVQKRKAGAGLIESYVHNNGKIGALVELHCETDFVAKNNEFRTLARDIAMQVAAMKPQDVDELLEQEFIKDSTVTIKRLIKRLSGKIGEKMKVERFVRFSLD